MFSFSKRLLMGLLLVWGGCLATDFELNSESNDNKTEDQKVLQTLILKNDAFVEVFDEIKSKLFNFLFHFATLHSEPDPRNSKYCDDMATEKENDLFDLGGNIIQKRNIPESDEMTFKIHKAFEDIGSIDQKVSATTETLDIIHNNLDKINGNLKNVDLKVNALSSIESLEQLLIARDLKLESINGKVAKMETERDFNEQKLNTIAQKVSTIEKRMNATLRLVRAEVIGKLNFIKDAVKFKDEKLDKIIVELEKAIDILGFGENQLNRLEEKIEKFNKIDKDLHSKINSIERGVIDMHSIHDVIMNLDYKINSLIEKADTMTSDFHAIQQDLANSKTNGMKVVGAQPVAESLKQVLIPEGETLDDKDQKMTAMNKKLDLITSDLTLLVNEFFDVEAKGELKDSKTREVNMRIQIEILQENVRELTDMMGEIKADIFQIVNESNDTYILTQLDFLLKTYKIHERPMVLAADVAAIVLATVGFSILVVNIIYLIYSKYFEEKQVIHLSHSSSDTFI